MDQDSVKKYATLITSANRGSLTVIIYDIIDEEFAEALDGCKTSDDTKMTKALEKVRAFVNELIISLDMKYEISGRLASLYIYVNKCVNRALVSGKAEDIKEARHIMKELGSAFNKVAASDTSGPVMENVQSVYAGLTYGKGRVPDEVMVDGNDVNRGFLA